MVGIRARSACVRGIAWAVAAALLGVAVAAAWHHHEPGHDAPGHHDDGCTICSAVHQPQSDVAAVPIVVPAPTPIALVLEERPAAPGWAGRPAAIARGPPTA